MAKDKRTIGVDVSEEVVNAQTWTGFATDVYYVLSENQVTVFKNGKVEAHYLLS